MSHDCRRKFLNRDENWPTGQASSRSLCMPWGESFQESRMPGNPLVRFDEGRVGRTAGVALSPTLPERVRMKYRLPDCNSSMDAILTGAEKNWCRLKSGF